MERLLLVRHALAEGRESDPGLSRVGVRQAALLADRLAESGTSEVLHGPLRRTHETAQHIARPLGSPVTRTTLLDDRTPFPSDDHWHQYPRHRWDWLQAVPGTERDEDGAAIAAAWLHLASRRVDGALVAITHAFVVSSLVSHALGAPPSAWMQIPIDNASITELRPTRAGEWSVVSLNDTGHLTHL